MTIGRRDPPGLHTPPGYHHVTVAGGRRLVLLAEQCPLMPEGQVVPGDPAAQVDQIVADTTLALADAGGARTTSCAPSSMSRVPSGPSFPRCGHGFTGSAIGAAFTTASALLGVTCLGFAGRRVELDVTAVPG